MVDPQVERLLTHSPDAAVEQLATLPEGQWYERKSGRINARDLASTLVAFANAEGGHVVIGIHDGQIDGVTPQQLNSLRQAPIDFTSPTVRTDAFEVSLADSQTLLVLRVHPGERVHETTKGDCFLRIGDETRRLPFHLRRELEFDRGSAPFDGTAATADIEDLDTAQVEAYAALIGATSAESMLTARDLRTRDGRLTAAGVLLFAERPQVLFPSAQVRILRYASDDRGVGARMTLMAGGDVRCEGSVPHQIAEASDVIDQWIPSVQALAVSGRFESRPIIPRNVWLEGLVNAVLHRSYSMMGDHIRVEIFPNRLEISSPGRFPGIADPTDPLTISRYARNPRIIRVCSDLGIARELGEGIKRIFAEMRSVGLTDPIYTQSGSTVRLTLSAADALPADLIDSLPAGARLLLDVLRLEGRPLGTGQVADLAGMARPTAIRHLQRLRAEGIVRWDGQSARDPRATWRLR
ncbi:helix-turn-helix domain-containing protein [Pseudactinotalea sp. HY158]|nr:helix-turn-helix domain-containing protein [Pseudactinotalea sp. HY158]